MDLPNKVTVFDFETDSLNVTSQKEVTKEVNKKTIKELRWQGSITQIGAVTFDLRNLEVDEGSELLLDVRPDYVDERDYIKNHYPTLLKHAEWQNKSVKDIVESFKKGMEPKEAWKIFMGYCKERSGGGMLKKTIPGGQNIIKFDIPIVERYCKQFNTPYPFNVRIIYDLLLMTPWWFPFAAKPPSSFSMDNIHDHFKMPGSHTHNGLQDAKDECELIIRFLSMHKKLIKKVPVLNNGAQ